MPHGVDQPFWGNRIAALGVGPRPVPRSELSAQSSATALRTALTDNGMRERATLLGEQIADEDGITNAIEIFDRNFGRCGSELAKQRAHCPGTTPGVLRIFVVRASCRTSG
ncbi:hypothetical protein V1227_09660 [Lentzea sp. DG1S-22]|uniref:glycosyltransferase n=1 Tax=Lentzea sp. DG1S-22 TaxID=3108822 RepID=UPI002E75C0A8|nr:hypothetical protein [Lentzea sp. DG1S-22]WVH82991.1 hypothetical protein V1227_09660 [Lentzea sp. DG1S-22]